MCNRIGLQTGCIVATHLIFTCSKRRRTVVITNNNIGVCREASLEIRPNWGHKNHKQIFFGGMNTYLCPCSYQQRTHIKRSPALISRDIFLIKTNDFLHHLNEKVGWNLWHQNATAGALQTRCILFNTENTYFPVRTTISFQPFKSLLTIVKTCSCHVKMNIFFRAYLYFAPLSVAIIAANIIICWSVTKR